LKFGREVRVLPGFASAQKGGVRVPILPMQAGSNRDWYGWRASSTHQETLMARSIRLIYRNIKGRVRQNFGWDGLTERSAVLITAAEWRPTADPFDSPPGRPLLGEANVYVTNIGPHDPEGNVGGVEFHLHVDWNSPLHVMVTITDLGPIEEQIVIG
jgi:hypothetical protein